MEKEFVPYHPSLDMKELGFDEPCFGYYDPLLGDYPIMNSDCINPKPTLFNHNISSIIVSAPLYHQAFSWFREKHNLYNQIHKGYGWEGIIRNSNNGDILWNDGTYNSPEEAELACLKKLIEICKK